MKYEIRVVSESGKLTFRKCVVDSDGDIEEIPFEGFFIKTTNIEELKEYSKCISEALTKPILTFKGCVHNRWVDDCVLDGLLGEIE